MGLYSAHPESITAQISPVAHWLRLCVPNAGGMGSITGWERSACYAAKKQNKNYINFPHLGFPGDSDSKEPACNAGDPGSIPGLGRCPGEGNGNPLQYSCLENPIDRGACELQSMGSQ